MYKIVKVVEISRTTLGSIVSQINKHINAELQEDEFLLHIEYFKDNEPYSTCPTLSLLTHS